MAPLRPGESICGTRSRRTSGTGIGFRALTLDLPVLPRGTHSLESITEANMRDIWPTTSRKSQRRRLATSIIQWM